MIVQTKSLFHGQGSCWYHMFCPKFHWIKEPVQLHFFSGTPCLQDITSLLCNWFLLSETSSAVILSLREIGSKLLLPPLSQLHFIKPPLLLQVLGITFFSVFLCWKHCDFSILDGIFNFCFEGDPLQLARKLDKDPPSHLLYRRMKFDKE